MTEFLNMHGLGNDFIVFDARDPGDVVATVSYGNDLPSIVRKGHVIGAQFHPEKSHANGLALFRNFAGL